MRFLTYFKKGLDLIGRLEESVESVWRYHKRAVLVVAFMALLAASWPYLLTGSNINNGNNGDADYFLQGYEAVRKTIVDYHQFPWWNPWVGGGVPLLANPQIGVVSPQTVLVLVFGTPLGLKLSIILFKVIGFAGMFLLLRRFLRSSVLLSVLLAFCWANAGFFAGHLFEHYTFVFFLMFPLLLYMQLRLAEGRMWLWYGVALGLFALSAVHYAFIHIALLLGASFIGQLWFLWRRGGRRRATDLLLRAAAAGAVFLALAGMRIWATLQYIQDFPRLVEDRSTEFLVVLKALFTPEYLLAVARNQQDVGLEYAALEYSAYIGLFMAVAFVVAAGGTILIYRKTRRTATRLKIFLPFLATALLFFVAMGNVGHVAPYSWLQELPVLSSMQVSTRWLIWTCFFILIAIAVVSVRMGKQRARYAILLCVMVATLELLAINMWPKQGVFAREPIMLQNGNTTFVQTELFNPLLPSHTTAVHADTLERYLRGYSFEYEATLNNIGEIRGYEPLFDTRIDTAGRCNELLPTCAFVRSHNATVISWSPNEIILRRSGPGPVVLNIAPSNYWTINGVRLCPDCTVTGAGNVTIADPAQELRLRIDPPLL